MTHFSYVNVRTIEIVFLNVFPKMLFCPTAAYIFNTTRHTKRKRTAGADGADDADGARDVRILDKMLDILAKCSNSW